MSLRLHAPLALLSLSHIEALVRTQYHHAPSCSTQVRNRRGSVGSGGGDGDGDGDGGAAAGAAAARAAETAPAPRVFI